MYYERRDQGQDEKEPEPSGCLETLILIRVVFGILFWPLVALIVLVGAVLVIFTLLFTNPYLGLLALLILISGIAAFAWWDRNRLRPPR